MYKKFLEKIEKEVSGQTAFSYLSEISRFHRVQASPGIRAAVNYAVKTMKDMGLEAEAHSYRADGKTYCWSCHIFKEWDCKDAELRLVEPSSEARPLALWSETKHSLIERSFPTPEGGVEAELVALDDGEEEADYRKLDVKGKMVLTGGNVARVYELAVVRRGAIGIIFDGMATYPPIRVEGDLDDALQRGRSGGWTGDEQPCIGFVVSPRTGRWLRGLVEKQRRSKKPVRVWANVESRFYSGSVENAAALIPGETREEVTVVAHICHPQGYANDNASGCGAAMEAARALQRLISRGDLPRPRRGIRFTLVPEMGGSFAWLAENEDRIKDMVAAVNLDMVGENQDLCGGPFAVVRTPDSLPSYANLLMEKLLDEVKIGTKGIGGAGVPIIKYAVTPFSGGSDHYIYSDPSVGVPCVGLAQWPDKFYHTSWDTLDKVDPQMLRRAAVMTATYAYFIASMGVGEATWLASEVYTGVKRGLAELAQRKTTEAIQRAEGKDYCGRLLAEGLAATRRALDYELDKGIKTVESVSVFSGGDQGYLAYKSQLTSELEDAAKRAMRDAKRAIAEYGKTVGVEELPRAKKSYMKKSEKRASKIVPRRTYRGPVSLAGYTHMPWYYKLSAEDRDALWKLGKDHPDARSYGNIAVYWADGKRSLLDISRLVEMEAGATDLEYLAGYFELLRKLKLLEY